MRVLIVDDEPAARQRMAIMLEELDIEVVGQAENGVVALQMVRERRPDVVLLDIQMPEVDGFDVARHLPEPRPYVVFQTAYDEHALTAFDHAALDYLVKPVSLDRLRRAMNRARAAAAGPEAAALEAIRAALADAGDVAPARLLVRDTAGHRLTPLDSILRFSAEEGSVYAHTGEGRALVDYTLKELESRTGPRFLRASRSDLVNVALIKRVLAPGDGTTKLILSDGSTVPVSRRQTAHVWRALGR